MVAGQAGKKQPQRQSTARVAPGARNPRCGRKNESALAKSRMGNCQTGYCEGPTVPQHDIEIEHPGAPARASAATAERMLDLMERMEHVFRIEPAAHDRRGIGETAVRRAERRGFDDPRSHLALQSAAIQRTESGAQHIPRSAMFDMPDIRPQRDEVAMVIQAVRYPARYDRKDVGGGHGRTPYRPGVWQRDPGRFSQPARRIRHFQTRRGNHPIHR